MPNRPAVLTLPGLSTTSILVNLPCITTLSGSPSPIIIVDKYDYERLRGRDLKGIGTNRKAPYLGMIYDELRRRGIIRLIDYSKYYPESDQRRYLQHNQKLLEKLSEQDHKQIAVKGVNSWIKYARGNYQGPFRAALGEDEEVFTGLRQNEESLKNRMERGRGDPAAWNKKLINKSVAALVIRHNMDQQLDINIEYVISGPEHGIIGDIFKMGRYGGLKNHPTTANILDTDYEISSTDASYLEKLNPDHHIAGMQPEAITQTRDIYDTIGEVATEMVGNGHNDWVRVGPSLALPQYSEIFDAKDLQAQIQSGMNVRKLTKEAENAINILKQGSGENFPSNKFHHEADWVAEMHNITSDGGRENINDIINHSLSVSNYTSELQALTDDHNVSQAAAYIAASILSDPIHRYDENDIYRRSMELAARLDLSSFTESELEEVEKERSGATWGETRDWFEAEDRDR